MRYVAREMFLYGMMYFSGNSQIKMDLHNSIKVMKINASLSLFYRCDRCFFLSSVVQKTAGEIQNKPAYIYSSRKQSVRLSTDRKSSWIKICSECTDPSVILTTGTDEEDR